MTTAMIVKKLIKDNPELTDKEISDQADLRRATVTTTIGRMVKRGELIRNDDDGVRSLQIAENSNEELRDFKRETLLATVNQLVAINENETNSHELRQNGALIVRILEKL